MGSYRGGGMDRTDRIDLAHEPSFGLGRLEVLPALHQLIRSDGKNEVLQHRVMQVLVALARADGAIVTREELTMTCWDGRVVGEDAINRILSRLRALSNGIGAGSFRIETVTRVGYRLLREGQVALDGPARHRVDRRLFIGAGVATAAAAGAALTVSWWRSADGPPTIPDDVAPLWAQSLNEYRQGSADGNNRAIGFLRQVVQRRPDFADGWGLLGTAYAQAFWGRGFRNDAGMEVHARAAIARARALDQDNPYAALAEAALLPLLGEWLARERILRAGLEHHPDNDLLLSALGWTLGLVGRWTEAIAPAARAIRISPTTPMERYLHATALWSANRLEEADRAIDEGLNLFPGYYALWFARFYVDLFTGRVADAIAFGEDRAARPVGIADDEIDHGLMVARAMQTRRPGDVETAMQSSVERARHSVGRAENAIQFACGFGRVDPAFEIAAALFFGRGFDPGEVRFTPEQGNLNRRNDRRTQFLFFPVTAPMRADARFDGLVSELGLAQYWRESGTRPDYRRG